MHVISNSKPYALACFHSHRAYTTENTNAANRVRNKRQIKKGGKV